MNRHSLTYNDLCPEPVNTREPSPFLIWVGAAFTLSALYLLTVFLFSL
jgi:hypothetical protein